MSFSLGRQKALQTFKGSSSKTRSIVTLPTNPVLLRIFSSIQEEIDPHKIRINCGFLLKYISHEFLSFPKNSESLLPIQEISSNTMRVRPCPVCFERCQNILPQSSGWL